MSDDGAKAAERLREAALPTAAETAFGHAADRVEMAALDCDARLSDQVCSREKGQLAARLRLGLRPRLGAGLGQGQRKS